MLERGAGGVIILFNLTFAILGFMALMLGGWDSAATIVVVAVYFMLSTSVFVLAATGGLRDVTLELIHQSAGLARLLIVGLLFRQGKERQEWLQEDNHRLIELTPSVDASPETSRTYVAATPSYSSQHGVTSLSASATHKQALRQQARAWLLSLFDEATGSLSEHKVHMTSTSTDGWLKVKVPDGEVKRLLITSGALVYRQNGIALNRARVSAIRDIEVILPMK